MWPLELKLYCHQQLFKILVGYLGTNITKHRVYVLKFTNVDARNQRGFKYTKKHIIFLDWNTPRNGNNSTGKTILLFQN